MPLLLEEGELVFEGIELGGGGGSPHVKGGGLNGKSHGSDVDKIEVQVLGKVARARETSQCEALVTVLSTDGRMTSTGIVLCLSQATVYPLQPRPPLLLPPEYTTVSTLESAIRISGEGSTGSLRQHSKDLESSVREHAATHGGVMTPRVSCDRKVLRKLVS